MTIEERRRDLKLAAPKWGDPPPHIPHHVGNKQAKARGMRNLADFDLECASSLNMERAVEYISPSSITTSGWSLSTLLGSSKNFLPVHRIPFNTPDLHTKIEDFEKSEVPFIVQGWHNHEQWPQHLFDIDSFSQDVKSEFVKFP